MRNAERFGQGASMQSSRAAKGNQGELARIAASLDGNHANGFLHGGIHHPHHTSREFLKTHRTALLLQPFARDAARAPEIVREAAAPDSRGLPPAQSEACAVSPPVRVAAIAEAARLCSVTVLSHPLYRS